MNLAAAFIPDYQIKVICHVYNKKKQLQLGNVRVRSYNQNSLVKHL